MLHYTKAHTAAHQQRNTGNVIPSIQNKANLQLEIITQRRLIQKKYLLKKESLI
jgi:hypothetical protein